LLSGARGAARLCFTDGERHCPEKLRLPPRFDRPPGRSELSCHRQFMGQVAPEVLKIGIKNYQELSKTDESLRKKGVGTFGFLRLDTDQRALKDPAPPRIAIGGNAICHILVSRAGQGAVMASRQLLEQRHEVRRDFVQIGPAPNPVSSSNSAGSGLGRNRPTS
jgi:hypothetical protein